MYKTSVAIVLGSIVVAGAVYAEKPAIKKLLGIKPTVKVAQKAKVAPVRLGKPIEAVALDNVLPDGRMSVVVGDGQFAEVLFQPFTRTRLYGSLVTADAVPDRQRMVIWGKWDPKNPNVFKALAVSCRERVSDITVRQRIALACSNISQRRTVASIPDQQKHTVVMTAPASSVAIPEVTAVPVAVLPTGTIASIAKNNAPSESTPSGALTAPPIVQK